MPITINVSQNYTLAKLLTHLEKAGEEDVVVNIEKNNSLLNSRSNIEALISFAQDKNISLEIKSSDPDLQSNIEKILSHELVSREKEIINLEDNILNIGKGNEEIKEVSLKNGTISSIDKSQSVEKSKLPGFASVISMFNANSDEAEKLAATAENQLEVGDESTSDTDNISEAAEETDESASLSFTELAKKTDTQGDRRLSKLLLKIFVIFLVLAGIVIGSILAFLWYVPSSNVEITANSNSLVKIINISADAKQTTVNLDSNMIPAFQVSVTDVIEEQIETNGTKTIGEKSIGEVTIVNPLKQSYEIDKGTVLRIFKDKDGNVVGNDKAYEYILQKDITIPGAQEEVETQNGLEVQTTIVSGQVNAPIEASEIGGNYNIDANYTFKIVGFNKTEVTVKNTKKFAGGSTEEIKVVGDQDKDALLSIARSKLEESLEQKIKQKIVLGQNLNDSSINYEIVKQAYSHDVGAETDKIKINLEMRATGIAYKNSDVEKIVESLLPTFVPDSYDLKNGEYEYDVKLVSSDEVNQTADLQIKVNTFITPDIDLEKLKNDLKGLDIVQAQKYLDQLNDVKYTISLTPSFINKMPRNINKIDIKLLNE